MMSDDLTNSAPTQIKPLYLDNASTTKMDDRVFESMKPYFLEFYGNASSKHEFGKIAKDAIDIARKQVAKIINCFDEEIIFTSGATESINLALKGYVEANIEKGNHIITVKTEHKAVLATCEYLETKGIEVTYLDVDENGLISLEELENTIKKETLLIAVMYVNNEIGIIQPISEIGKIANENNIVFFCDATQAVGKISVDVERENIDMLCFSGHKLNGPKGIGILYIKNGLAVTPLLHGGGQEKGMRGGTYNTPLIVGIGKACEICYKEFEENLLKINQTREILENHFEVVERAIVNFKYLPRAPHIISLTLEVEAEEFLMLNSQEFLASTGSACNANLMEPSHVLKAIFTEQYELENILRISVNQSGSFNKEETVLKLKNA